MHLIDSQVILTTNKSTNFYLNLLVCVNRQGSQRTFKMLRAIPLVLTLLSRNCPPGRPFNNSSPFLSLFFFILSFVPQRLSKKLEPLKFYLKFETY